VADTFNKQQRSRIMAAVRGWGNKATELVLVRIFHEAGLTGWRRHAKIPGRPDFIFRKERVAIFVDGCFWHGCAKHCRKPATNKKYWDAKIRRNIKRDRRTRAELRGAGWKVLRIWEHDLKKNLQQVQRKIERNLNAHPHL
jgi:DNA mismatch endonuclease, patch repair protein